MLCADVVDEDEEADEDMDEEDDEDDGMSSSPLTSWPLALDETELPVDEVEQGADEELGKFGFKSNLAFFLLK